VEGREPIPREAILKRATFMMYDYMYGIGPVYMLVLGLVLNSHSPMTWPRPNQRNAMRKRLTMFASIAAIAFATGTVAHETKVKAIIVVHPWVLETEQTQADLHARIKNTGKVAERLLRATTELAATTTIVDATGKNMNDLEIPGLDEITLQPGGAHILLRGLKKPLRPYDSFGLTLVFEKAGTVQVEVLVEEKT
jgi:copper(I)-binding protein